MLGWQLSSAACLPTTEPAAAGTTGACGRHWPFHGTCGAQPWGAGKAPHVPPCACPAPEASALPQLGVCCERACASDAPLLPPPNMTGPPVLPSGLPFFKHPGCCWAKGPPMPMGAKGRAHSGAQSGSVASSGGQGAARNAAWASALKATAAMAEWKASTKESACDMCMLQVHCDGARVTVAYRILLVHRTNATSHGHGGNCLWQEIVHGAEGCRRDTMSSMCCTCVGLLWVVGSLCWNPAWRMQSVQQCVCTNRSLQNANDTSGSWLNEHHIL